MFTRVLYFCYEDVSNSFPPGHRYEESPSVERRSVCLSVRGTNTAIIIAPRIVVTMLAMYVLFIVVSRLLGLVTSRRMEAPRFVTPLARPFTSRIAP